MKYDNNMKRGQFDRTIPLLSSPPFFLIISPSFRTRPGGGLLTTNDQPNVVQFWTPTGAKIYIAIVSSTTKEQQS
jgi:hypothetical protein